MLSGIKTWLQQRRIHPARQMRFLSEWLDERFVIPGTRIRVGLDALIGLVPVAGDIVAALLSVYMLILAWALEVKGLILIRMAGNILLDLLLGATPIVGDVIDVFYKVNKQNLRLVILHLEKNQKQWMQSE